MISVIFRLMKIARCHLLLLAALVFCSAVTHAQTLDPLSLGFSDPPSSAKPHTWWHWMNGNISKEGISADLEAMAHIGLSGAQIFNVEQGEPAGPITLYSPQWHEMMQHAIREADRLGIELTLHNSPGWSGAGGPWVTP